MTREAGAQSPVDPSVDELKTKRGRKPSQAKLAMLESKRLFADKRRFPDDNGDGGNKKSKKKKSSTNDKNKKNSTPAASTSTTASDFKNINLKKKKNGKGKNGESSLKGKSAKNDHENDRRKKRKAPSRYRTESTDDDANSSDDEFWDAKKSSGRHNDYYDDREDFFFDSDSDDDLDNELLQNSDEDTEDASETDMATLEEEISEMKEQMYQQKIKELKGKLEELEKRTLPEFKSKFEELKREKEDWIRTAYAYKSYEEREIDREYEREKKQAKEDFEQKKQELKEHLIAELNEKKRLIENEKTTLELSGGIGPILPLEVKPTVTRKLRRRGPEPLPVAEKKRKTNSTPLNLLLNEEQILADLKKIGKHHKPHSSSTSEEKTPKPSKNADKCDPTTFPDGTDAKIKDEKLFYNKEWYQSGDPVYLNSRDGERFHAQIHSITSTREIWIKKLTEGTRLKIYVGHLQRGKYAIERREKK